MSGSVLNQIVEDVSALCVSDKGAIQMDGSRERVGGWKQSERESKR